MFLKWPLRSTLASDLFWWVRLNILNSNPKASTNVKFEVISTCFWSDVRGQLCPLTSFVESEWIFLILTPNHPLMWNLKSFWHVFEVISEVNLGLWPLLLGQIEYSQFWPQTIITVPVFVLWTRELMNQFLKNHQLNKAEIGIMNQFQIELVVYKILSPLCLTVFLTWNEDLFG